MAQKIDDKAIEYYSELVAYKGIQGRTASRLKEMAAIGMMQTGNASFGVLNVMDGMYIERVWNMDDQQFIDYLNWVKQLIVEKTPAIEKARKDVFSLLKKLKEEGSDIFSGIYEYRFDRLLVKVTRTMYDNFCIYYSTGNIGSLVYRFFTTEGEFLAEELLPVGFAEIADYLDNETGTCPVKYFFDNEGHTVVSMEGLVRTVSGFASPLLVRIKELEEENEQLKADVDHYARQL